MSAVGSTPARFRTDRRAVAAAALEGLPDGVLVVCDGEVVLANRAACRLIGRAAEEVIGGPPPEWLPPEPVLEDTEVTLPPVRGRRRRRVVAVSARPLAAAGGGTVVTLRDRSEQVEREASSCGGPTATASPACSTSARSARASRRRSSGWPRAGARSA